MRQLIYAMQFRGTVAPETNGAPNVLRATTIAPSGSIASAVAAEGLTTTTDAVPGADAEFESEVTMISESSFQEKGTITFGRGHRLHFSTVGQGYLGASPLSSLRHGAAIWRVEGGEGQFADATGLITSNFTVGELGELVDWQFGVIFVKQ
jgi:hypothetical protein